MSIPKVKRIGYGAAELGVSGSEVMLRVSLLIYYTQTVGLRPDLASYALALGLLWDAITDPLIGRVSDNSCIHQEKRRPFFLPAGFGLAVSLVLVFNVPDLDTQAKKFLYLLITYLATNTFLTLLSIPHLALAGDITSDQKIRMELFSWRLIFANIGLILGTVFPVFFVSFSYGNSSPDAMSSWLMGLTCLIGVSITLFSTKGFDKASTKDKSLNFNLFSYFTELKIVFSNKSFFWLLMAYMTATIGLTLNSSLALYYYKFFLKLDDISVRGIIAFFMLIFCLSIPLWIWATEYISKINIILINIFFLALMTTLGYPNFPPGSISWPLGAALLGGVFVGSVVLMDVLVADFADKQASLEKEKEKESSNLGLYFGFWKMGGKLSRALALILTGHSLSWIGFQVETNPSESVSNDLALLFGPGVSFFLLVSVIILYLGKKRSALCLK